MNQKNPAIKRILADVKELNKHPSSRYSAAPLENNMFEWHFTIRGPNDSAFEGGMYHGRILLPSEYPFKPPNIVFLTKNGRFEVGTKICLSISAYHEETWQPAWGVRTMLEAIISFLPSEGAGAIGALDWTKEERKKLALESKSYCCSTCGFIAELLSDPSLDSGPDARPSGEIADQIAQLQMAKVAPQNSEKAPGANSAFMNDLLSPDAEGSVSHVLAELTAGHPEMPLSPTTLIHSAELSLPTEDNAVNMLMIDSEKMEIETVGAVDGEEKKDIEVKKEHIVLAATEPVSTEKVTDETANEQHSHSTLAVVNEESIPTSLPVSSSLQTTEPVLCDEEGTLPSVPPVTTTTTDVYQFNESKESAVEEVQTEGPQGLRLDVVSSVASTDQETVLSPVSELRHRIHHSSSTLPVDSSTATTNTSTSNVLPHLVPPVVVAPRGIERINAVPVVTPPAVAVVAPLPRHVVPVRDAFDDIVDVLLRLTGLAILCVVYRIVGREE